MGVKFNQVRTIPFFAENDPLCEGDESSCLRRMAAIIFVVFSLFPTNNRGFKKEHPFYLGAPY
jgi:hypothetical protein